VRILPRFHTNPTKPSCVKNLHDPIYIDAAKGKWTTIKGPCSYLARSNSPDLTAPRKLLNSSGVKHT
jgi:hypothetical protein